MGESGSSSTAIGEAGRGWACSRACCQHQLLACRGKLRVSRRPAAPQWPGAQGAGLQTSPDHLEAEAQRAGAKRQGLWELQLWGQPQKLTRLEGKLIPKWDTYLAQVAGSHSCPSKSKKTRLSLMVGEHNDPTGAQLVETHRLHAHVILRLVLVLQTHCRTQ